MNIIFLDIDGVLNHYSSRKAEKFQLDQTKMMLVADLARETQAQIVISSTWRKGNSLAYFREIFWHFCTLYPARQYSWKRYKDDCEKMAIACRTPIIWDVVRGVEIECWLMAHEGTVKNYVILDDDSDMLPHQMPHFVKTNGRYGITKKDVQKAKEILNG